MSHKAYAWALQQTVGNSTAKALLLRYADASNEHEGYRTFLKRGTVATELEIDITTVDRANRLLSERGFIVKKPRFFDNRQTSNDYFVLVPESFVIHSAPVGLLTDGSTYGSDPTECSPPTPQGAAPAPNTAPPLGDAECSPPDELLYLQAISGIGLTSSQMQLASIPGEMSRLKAWHSYAYSGDPTIKKPIALFVKHLQSHDWPPTLGGPVVRPAACPDCETGGGRHTVDCPTLLPEPIPLPAAEAVHLEAIASLMEAA